MPFRSLSWMLWCAPLAAPMSLLAQARPEAPPLSAAVSDIRYEVTFDHATADKHIVHVVTTLTVQGSEPVLLSLPEWTPGAYELSWFSRWISNFSATGDGKSLTWDKLDFDTWRIRTSGTHALTVTFDVLADSLDNAMAWTRDDFALFNGTNLFLYPEGRSAEFAARVTVHTDPEWRVATGMHSAGPANTFSAANYHDLVDMPFFVGKFDFDSAQISGRWVRYATYPAGSVLGMARVSAWDQLKRVIPPEVAVFGEAPWENYTVMQISDSTYQGASGLEHQNSHVDVVSPVAIGSEFQPSLYAHEIFHSWNVKRMRPADMWPYRYDRAQPTPWLWVSEGITDYYADLASVRGGVVDASGFYALTATKINEVGTTPPVSLHDASINTWVHPADGTQYVYYAKGSLAGLMLDITIRDATDNKHSLDDVMREVYQTAYKHGRGFTATDWWGAVSRAAGGKSFTDFAARYVDGRDDYPWDSLLALVGLRSVIERMPRLGVTTAQDTGGVRVAALDPDGAAQAAGLKIGDYIIAIGDLAMDDQQFGEKFRAMFANATPGSPIPIKIKRGSAALTLTSQLRLVPGGVRIEADPGASAKAVKVRNGILKGVVDR